jgi:hypothetical protein
MDGPFVYCIAEREFLRSREGVVVIGRSGGVYARIKSYPKGSLLLGMTPVVDDKVAETDLIAAFSAAFHVRREFGREYFTPPGAERSLDAAVKAALPLFHMVSMKHIRCQPALDEQLSDDGEEHAQPQPKPALLNAGGPSPTATPSPAVDTTDCVKAFVEAHRDSLEGAEIPLDLLIHDFNVYAPGHKQNKVLARLKEFHGARVTARGIDPVIRFPQAHATIKALRDSFSGVHKNRIPPPSRKDFETALGAVCRCQ